MQQRFKRAQELRAKADAASGTGGRKPLAKPLSDTTKTIAADLADDVQRKAAAAASSVLTTKVAKEPLIKAEPKAVPASVRDFEKEKRRRLAAARAARHGKNEQ